MKHRKLYFDIESHLDKKEFTIIEGSRQTGKTTLLEQIKAHLIQKKKKVFYMTMEDPILLQDLNGHPENIFHFFKIPENEKVYLLIDEIQYLDNPSNFLKLLFDKYSNKLKIIATGSSAFYIDSKFKDSLTGRKRIFYLYPFDFDEYIFFKQEDLLDELKEIRKKENYISLRRKELESYFNEYLMFGGYPAVVLATEIEEKKYLLKELLISYLKKDIYESRIKNEDVFYRILRTLASQTSNLLNIHELSNTFRVSTTLIDRYLYVLHKNFYIYLVRPFYQNIRKELTKMPKLYFHDLGLRNMLLKQFIPLETNPDKGKILENYIFIRLRQLYEPDDIRYWRTADGNEVDFVVNTFYQSGFAIEVKYNSTMFTLSKYKKFTKAYPKYPLQLRAYLSENNSDNLLGL